MAHIALYRKWRPLSFEDVVEQQHIVETLKNSVKADAASHAYLFCGTRGTGKTTLAKIFARAVNCLSPIDGNPCNECDICKGILEGSILDVIEIDAASNNGVDDVRQIKEAVMYVPALARFKVYIIDEVHMLSTGAFNALLKTLEEPPQSVIFILATTEPHKLPATILSRCQRFDFKRISVEGLTRRLKLIADSSEVFADSAALSLIARLSEGGMRDAISLLDQCMATGKDKITREAVMSVAGLSSAHNIGKLAMALIDKNGSEALTLISQAISDGRELLPLCSQLVEWFRNLMIFQIGGEALKLIEWDEDELATIKEASLKLPDAETVLLVKELSDAEARLKWSENQRILFEITSVKICTRNIDADSVTFNERMTLFETRIAEIEKKISQGFVHDAGANNIKSVSRSEAYIKEQTISKPVSKEKTDKQAPKQSHLVNEMRDWPDVVEFVRTSGRMKVYAYLLDTKCVITNDNTAVIVVSSEDGLKKTVLSRNDSIEIITEGIMKVTGKEMKIKVKDEKELGNKHDDIPDDPVLEKVKKFASENNISLDIKE